LRETGDEGGIDATAEENPDLHIGHQLTLYRVLEKQPVLIESLCAILSRNLAWRRGDERVLPEGQLGTAKINFHDVTRSHLLDLLEESVRRGQISEPQELGETLQINRVVYKLQERPEFG